MNTTLCTIGFAGKTAEEFFFLLTQAGVKRLIDIRENRHGQLSGFAKYPDLVFFLDQIAGIAYTWEPRLAPTPEIRKTYRTTKDWDIYEASFLQLMRERDIPRALEPLELDETLAFLCSEPGPEKCHRRLVAELLAEYSIGQGQTVEIRHLVATKCGQPRSRKKRKAGHERTPDQ
jgi:uncharacterized protein (DUF488 family)